MYKQITIQTLKKQGKKPVEISREMDCHRNTVRNVINRPKPIEKFTRNRPSYFDPYRDQIKGWLDKKVTHLRIYELLRETHTIERTYDSLSKYIKKEFPKIPEAFGVQVTLPGEVAEVDFGYAGLKPINAPGETPHLVKTWFLSVRLNHSRYAYREMTHDQKVITFIKGITKGFEFFGGVPKRLKIDNLRSAVIKNQHYDLQLNADFLAWANHYGTVINPCTPYSPEQKGGVESDMKYIENNFLSERHFSDWPDLQHQFKEWSEMYANQRIHGVTKKVPCDVFLNEEKQTLQLLPATIFSLFERCERKVQTNCHIFFRNHYYSVPAKLVGQVVTLRFNDKLLKVISGGEEVACHAVSSEIGTFTTLRSHLPEYKCYGVTEYQQKYEAKMADIGAAAHTYFKEILIKQDSYWFKTIRVILGLAKEYGEEAVNLSLQRALEYHVTDASIIKRIVVKQLYLLGTAPKLLETATAVGSVRQLSAPHSKISETVALNEQVPNISSVPSTFLNSVLATVKQRLSPLVSSSSSHYPLQPTNSPADFNRDLGYYQQLLK
jgi:transposase